jgi:hypothetical protein
MPSFADQPIHDRDHAQITRIDSNGVVILPPTMGAAIRCMSSDPVPCPI